MIDFDFYVPNLKKNEEILKIYIYKEILSTSSHTFYKCVHFFNSCMYFRFVNFKFEVDNLDTLCSKCIVMSVVLFQFV